MTRTPDTGRRGTPLREHFKTRYAEAVTAHLKSTVGADIVVSLDETTGVRYSRAGGEALDFGEKLLVHTFQTAWAAALAASMETPAR